MMNELAQQFLSAVISAAVGSLITIAVFRSRLDQHTQALAAFVAQRAEDRALDLRENEAMRREFRDLCTSQVAGRQQELNFIQRQVDKFHDDLRQSERRQRYVMDIVTAIAHKQGIHHRITDTMVDLNNGGE